jgi:hypothetical protein
MLALSCASGGNRIDEDYSQEWLSGNQNLSPGEGILVFSVEPIMKHMLAVDQVILSGPKPLIIEGYRFAGPISSGQWSIESIIVRDLKSGAVRQVKFPAELPKAVVSSGRPANMGQIIFGVGEKMIDELNMRSHSFTSRSIENNIVSFSDQSLGNLAFMLLPKGNPIENNGSRIKIHWGQKLAF